MHRFACCGACGKPARSRIEPVAAPQRCACALVPGGGVEPPRGCPRRILSPLRLPVPPSRPGMRSRARISLVRPLSIAQRLLLQQPRRQRCVPFSTFDILGDDAARRSTSLLNAQEHYPPLCGAERPPCCSRVLAHVPTRTKGKRKKSGRGRRVFSSSSGRKAQVRSSAKNPRRPLPSNMRERYTDVLPNDRSSTSATS